MWKCDVCFESNFIEEPTGSGHRKVTYDDIGLEDEIIDDQIEYRVCCENCGESGSTVVNIATWVK
ncbi:MAG: hypothetical protein ACRC0S_02165 [Fusobacteriaceae bacterium]